MRRSVYSYLTDREKRLIAAFSIPDGWQTLKKEGQAILSRIGGLSLKLARPEESPQSYAEKIQQAKEYILSGDIYQVNLSQSFLFEGAYSPYALFFRLVESHPAPFMAYLKFPGWGLVSASPERFLAKKGRLLETRPIKGTAPRGNTAQEDQVQKEALLSSPKETAELLMITDLMRNDLAKSSMPGSVVTKKLWHCEAYKNVFHLVSVVQAMAKPSLHAVEILRAAFPGGSISGCPKLRALEIIDALEQRPRGVYTGSIGYFTPGGDFDFNIAIRTLECRGSKLELQLGAGIVIDSDPAKEYAEIIHKGAPFFRLFQGLLALKEVEEHGSVSFDEMKKRIGL